MAFYAINRLRRPHPHWGPEVNDPFCTGDATAFHAAFSESSPTPLYLLSSLAGELQVGGILVKDESCRFGLNAFKALGASYAIYRFLCDEWHAAGRPLFAVADLLAGRVIAPGTYTFCTATDGNHGRAVAWTAKRLLQKAVIYMPNNATAARVAAIRSEGAKVVVVDGNYDDAVSAAKRDAAHNGWQVIADTAYAGYLAIPTHIMAGYLTIFREIDRQLQSLNSPGIDYVFVQAGVGSLAAAAAWYYVNRGAAARPRLICVEPLDAACFVASAESGKLTTVVGKGHSIMAGLDCPTPSLLAWPLIRDSFDLFLAIGDDYAVDAMRRFYYPAGSDPRVVSGESGAAGLAGLTALLTDPALAAAKEEIAITGDSHILLINTEGATDPDHFAKVVSR
jgi:diaminopropionate ammonia-lyase